MWFGWGGGGEGGGGGARKKFVKKEVKSLVEIIFQLCRTYKK
jgi:hypothetical protein